MEQVLLIENSEEARGLIVGHAPKNVMSAWTLSGDDVKPRGVYSNDLSRQTAKMLNVSWGGGTPSFYVLTSNPPLHSPCEAR